MTETKMDPAPHKPEWAQSKREKDNAARQAAGLKPHRRRWPWVLLALVVLAAVAFFLLRGQQGTAEPEVIEAPPPPVMQLNPAEVSTIVPRVLQQSVKVTGSLAPQRQTVLASQVSGRVETVAVRPGDRVEPGDVLVQVDTENLRIQLAQQASTAQATRAQLVLAQSQLARTTDLIGRGLTPSSGLEEAQSSVNALKANLEALEAQVQAAQVALQNATIKAPFSGIVSARSVEPNQLVSAGTPLLSLVDLTTVEFQASASVGPSAQIEAGQTVTVTVEGLADRTFAGTVDRVNPVALSGTRTIPVYISMDNPDEVLRGGMFASGQIVVAELPDALAVPKGALREDADGYYVLKVENDIVVRQGVEQGPVWNGGQLVEITAGLTNGDVVVSVPLAQVVPGDKVEMVEG